MKAELREFGVAEHNQAMKKVFGRVKGLFERLASTRATVSSCGLPLNCVREPKNRPRRGAGGEYIKKPAFCNTRGY